MALNLFSDSFAPLETTATRTITVPDSNHRADVHRHHARVGLKAPKINIANSVKGSTAGDVLVMERFKSADCIGEIFYSDDGLGASIAGDLGCYLVNVDRDVGAAVDGADQFADTLDMDAAVRLEAFTNNALVDVDRWKPLWELLGFTADTYTDYYLAFTLTSALTSSDKVAMLEIAYTEG